MATLLSYALTTLADVKETLGIDAGDTSQDNLIIRKINQATEMIEHYCDRRFANTTYTQQEYDATNSDQLSLKQRPVTDTTTLILQQRDSTLNEDDWTTVDTELYFTDSGAGVIDLAFNASGHWNRYRVTYSAGYATIPSDLAEACVTLAAYLVDNATAGTGIKSKQEGQRKIEYFDSNASGGTNSLFTQLNIDEILNSYANFNLLDNK